MRVTIILLMFITEASFAQFNFPELSPESTIHQPVGYSTIDIRYGRPAARGRKIIDGLVPYKRLWRTGAGKCTTIQFNKDVTINGKTIKAGIYSIATIPDAKSWTVMLNSDTTKIYGDPSEYDVNKEVIRFDVKSESTARFYETLTVDLDIINGDAEFYLSWERTQIHFKISTGSHAQALENIKTSLAKTPNDTELLTSAAWYYYMTNESPEQILTWLDKSLSIREERWTYIQKVDILERIKNYKEATTTAKKAITFLQQTKPEGWEESVTSYESRIKGWKN